MLYREKKPPGVLDFLDLKDRSLRGWKIEQLYTVGFNRSKQPSVVRQSACVRQAIWYLHGDMYLFLVCREDEPLQTLHLMMMQIMPVSQPPRELFALVHKRKNIAIPLGSIDSRKMKEDRDAHCPRAGNILPEKEFDKLLAMDRYCFLKALRIPIPEGFKG